MKEKPLLVEKEKPFNLMEAFNSLTPEDQTEYLNLYDPEPGMQAPSHPELGNRFMKVVRIIVTNRIGVYGSIGAIYKIGSRINHSCSPNVIWNATVENMFCLEVRACRDIEKGDELVASYP